MLDPTVNFGRVTVSQGYDNTATSITLVSGDGAVLPDPSTDGEFNLVWWDSTNYPNPTDDPNVEIVRVTAKTTDTLTITRAQEGTSASTKNTSGATYQMILSFTKKSYDQLLDSPASSTDNAIVRFNGTGGDTVQDSGITIDDSNNISGINNTTGLDTNLVSGTAGVSGNLVEWNTDGDAVDSGKASPTGVIVGTTDTQTLTNKDISNSNNTYRSASTTETGAVELATDAETDTGTDSTRAITPSNLDSVRGTTRGINSQTGTTYTLVLDDRGKLIELTNSSAITLTIPTNASVALPVGTKIAVAQGGAGTVTIAGDTGVTLKSQGSATDLNGQDAMATLVKVATDTWRLEGNLV